MHYNRCAGESVRQQLVKMLITIEPHGIFGSNLAYMYLYILKLFSLWCENGNEALPGISSVDRGLLVKMLRTLEPHGLF